MRRPLFERLFVDTSAFVAQVSSEEVLHEPVEREIAAAERRRAQAVTTNAVVIETATLLRRRHGYAPSKRFLDIVQATAAEGGVLVLYEDEELMGEASGIFNAWADRKLSLTDAVSFAVCHRLGINTALTLDDHFREAGFRVLPDVRRT
jgi:predicted nucleic acid-binding protein